MNLKSLLDAVTATPKDVDTIDSSFRAGRLQFFLNRWKILKPPSVILKMISNFRIPFLQKPPLVLPNFQLHVTPISPEMSIEIQQMLDLGVLEIPQVSPSFVSPMFLIQKPDHSYRPIFNLKKLNDYIALKKFYLISHLKIPDFLQPSDWLTKIDMSQAYFHLNVSPSHRCFLRMVYRRTLYQMTCLPFGIACAPRCFAMVTNFLAETLRKTGIRIVVYLDDFLLASQDRSLLQQQTSMVMTLMQALGWILNLEKSVLTPTQQLEFLGVNWDTLRNQKSLPVTKVRKLREEFQRILSKHTCSLKEARSVLGRMNFANFLVPQGRLHCRHFQSHLRFLLSGRPRRQYPLPREVLDDLQWWLKSVSIASYIHLPQITHFLVTDASDYGWGALLNDVHLAGVWEEHQQTWHSNLKELVAIQSAIELQAKELRGASLLIQSDNTTALAYLRNEGGSKSKKLMSRTRQVLQLIHKLQISATFQHLPGRFNDEADRLSRGKMIPEWHLLPEATSAIFQTFGHPDIDLFASKQAHVVQHYVTLDPWDSVASFHNAFSRQWNYRLAWIFPPPALIPRVLIHLNKCQGQYIIIAPRWQKSFWRPDIVIRALSGPIEVNNLSESLVDATTGQSLPQINNLALEAWLIGGGTPSSITGHQKRLPY